MPSVGGMASSAATMNGTARPSSQTGAAAAAHQSAHWDDFHDTLSGHAFASGTGSRGSWGAASPSSTSAIRARARRVGVVGGKGTSRQTRIITEHGETETETETEGQHQSSEAPTHRFLEQLVAVDEVLAPGSSPDWDELLTHVGAGKAKAKDEKLNV